MRKQVTRVLIVAVIAAMSLAAQGMQPFHDRGGVLGDAQTSADAIARRVEFLTALLTLTAAQASQATTIFTTAAGTIAPLETTLDTARTSLRTAVQTNSINQIEQLAAQIGTGTGQVLAAHSKAEAAFYALLTAEQRTRYDAVGNRGGGGGGKGGH